MTSLEIAGTVLSVLAVWLTVRQNSMCWPIGIVSVVIYAWVYFTARLYADSGLQLIYVALQFYGWHAWLHGGANRTELSVSRIPGRILAILLAFGAVGAVVLGALLRRNTDASLPYLDATTTSFSLIAQWMQTRKWIEHWIVWIVVDVVYVGMLIFKKLNVTAGLYALFIVLAILGLAQWRKGLSGQASAMRAEGRLRPDS